MENVLNNLENQFDNIENIKEQILRPKMLKLHTGMEGFDSPDVFGVYRHDGGSPLGVVGNRYKPMDLELMLDSIVASVMECDIDLDLSKLEYKEYLGGKKVAFILPLPTKEIKGSPMVGDIIERRLEFRTGFDGLTKSTITEYYNRLWCANGCSHPHQQTLGFKNTLNNHVKIYNLCNYIMDTVQEGEAFLTRLGQLSEIKFTAKQKDEFIRKVTGFGFEEYKDLNTRKRNILDAINESVAIEANNTGNNMFSLVNGITRYVTHNKAEKDEEAVIYNTTNQKLTNKALTLAFSN